MISLYGRRRDDVSLAAALRWAGIDGVGLLASPVAYTVTAVSGGICRTPDATADLTNVHDARVFNPTAELRWWHAGDGRGPAVVLCEDRAGLPADGDDVEAMRALKTIDGGYLLWGRTVDGAPAGWSAVATRRIGTLLVPVPAGTPGGRIRIAAREYVTSEPVHGNAYVAAERLLWLQHIPRAETTEE